jgi:hypothetical protein
MVCRIYQGRLVGQAPQARLRWPSRWEPIRSLGIWIWRNLGLAAGKLSMLEEVYSSSSFRSDMGPDQSGVGPAPQRLAPKPSRASAKPVLNRSIGSLAAESPAEISQLQIRQPSALARQGSKSPICAAMGRLPREWWVPRSFSKQNPLYSGARPQTGVTRCNVPSRNRHVYV